jgi:hypothetical protein
MGVQTMKYRATGAAETQNTRYWDLSQHMIMEPKTQLWDYVL